MYARAQRDLSPTHHGTFTLQLAATDHFDGLRKIYTGENERPEVYIREPAIIRERIESKFYQVILDPSGHVCAATASYPQPEVMSANYPRNYWHEVGSTRSIKGFGFHGALTGAQALMAFLYDPPETFVYADVKADAERVINKFEAAPLKWQRFEPSADLVRFFKQTVSANDAKVDQPKVFFKCPLSSIPMMAQHLLNHKEVPTIARKGETLDFQVRLPMSDTQLKELVEEQAFFEGLRPDLGWQEAQTMYCERRSYKMRAAAHRPESHATAAAALPFLTPEGATA